MLTVPLATTSLPRLLRALPSEVHQGLETSPDEPSSSPPAWMRSGGWHVFARPFDGNGTTSTIEPFTLDNGRVLSAGVDDDGRFVVPFSLEEAYANYISESWRAASPNRRLPEKGLDAFYRIKSFIPRSVQLSARRLLTRWQGSPEFPSWPLDTSVARLLQLYAFSLMHATNRDELDFRWFWPDSYHAALILTHDVETEAGIRLAVELADLEEELGFRSSFNFGRWYRVDPGVLNELRGRGFEIGMHGLSHDRSLFSSRHAFEEQLPGLRTLATSLGAEGFRAPATHRVFDWLAELPISYDCSIPNSDPYEPQPGGCCTVWPFFIGSVVELPYTLPQDHTLLTLLGHRSPALWLEQSSRIESAYGLIQVISHPDPGYLADPGKRAVYREYLLAMAERRNVWRALPSDVAAWWRQRDAMDGRDGPVGRARRGAHPTDVVFEPPARGSQERYDEAPSSDASTSA
jgi:hypothetical protein